MNPLYDGIVTWYPAFGNHWCTENRRAEQLTSQYYYENNFDLTNPRLPLRTSGLEEQQFFHKIWVSDGALLSVLLCL